MSSPEMTVKNAEIVNRFSYHKPDQAGVDAMKAIRAKCLELALLIEDLAPHGRDKATALTNLQGTMMHANAAIVLQYPISE